MTVCKAFLNRYLYKVHFLAGILGIYELATVGYKLPATLNTDKLNDKTHMRSRTDLFAGTSRPMEKRR